MLGLSQLPLFNGSVNGERFTKLFNLFHIRELIRQFHAYKTFNP